MKTFKEHVLNEIKKGIFKGIGGLKIDGQKVDVEVELYGTDNKNNTFLTRIVGIDKKYWKTHPIGKEVAIPARITDLLLAETLVFTNGTLRVL